MITNDLTAQRAEMNRLRQMTPQAIADEFDKHCPICKRQIVPNVNTVEVLGKPRVTITWPDCCTMEF